MRKDTSGRVGFFAQLPLRTLNEIKRRSSAKRPQWLVVADAIKQTRGAAKAVGGK